MENKKDIGKAISDKLSSLDKTPKEAVWIGIREELDKKKKRRFIFFFFWPRTIGLLLAGAIAALFIYHQTVGFGTDLTKESKDKTVISGNEKLSVDNNPSGENPEANNGSNPTENNVAGNDENADENEIGRTNSNTVEKKDNGKTTDNGITWKSKKISGKTIRKNKAIDIVSKTAKGKNKPTQYSKTGRKKPGKNKSKNNPDILVQNGTPADKNLTGVLDLNTLKDGNSTANPIAEANKKKTDSIPAKKEKEKKKNIVQKTEEKDSTDNTKGFAKFHVDAFISPTYYGYFSNISTLDNRLNSNTKSTEVEFNYGAGLSYQLTERTSIRIGVNRIKLNYTTKNALVDTPNYSRIEYKPEISNQSIYDASGNATTMNITQNMTYTEIPLEGRYRFLDKKIGLNAIFGFSFTILNENTVSIKTNNGFTQNIGKTKDIFDTSISANIGLGIDYPVFKNAKAFVEPVFNYQAISFESSDYKPYYFGFRIGLRYALIDK